MYLCNRKQLYIDINILLKLQMKLPIDWYYCHISVPVIISFFNCKFSKNKMTINIVNWDYTVSG